VVFKEPCRFEFQKDANGLMRKVIVFPLEYLSKEPIPFTEDIVQKSPFLQHRIKNYQEYENQIGGLQKNQAIAKSDRKDPFLTTKIIILPDKEDNAGSLVNKAEEDTRMVLDALRQRSAGKCELCKQPAPFVTSDGIPYLEVHHIVPVSQGGKDTIDNEVLLCPNCHRKVHLVYSPSDIEILKKIGINSN
jgi:5-methylcytosine-specific restriction protein A